MNFKDHWDLDTALRVARNKSVDSQLWAEAVEWLLLYGPRDTISLLLHGSQLHMEYGERDLRLEEYIFHGHPCHTVDQLARSMGISKEHVRGILTNVELSEVLAHFLTDTGSETIH